MVLLIAGVALVATGITRAGVLTLPIADRRPAVAPAGARPGETAGVVFSTPHDAPLTLDLFVPADPPAPPPVVVLVHGGGWRSGSRHAWTGAARDLVAEGWAAATIDYRLRDTAPYPAAVDDVAAALRFLGAEGGRLGVDPNRLALMGGSAGGHLALLAAMTEPGVDAVVAFSPPTDLAALARPDGEEQPLCAADGSACRIIGLEALVAGWLGCTPRDCPDRVAAASPTHHVGGGDPPALIVHATDEVVPFAQATAFVDRLRDAGGHAELVSFPGRRHGSQLRAQSWSEVVAFLGPALSP